MKQMKHWIVITTTDGAMVQSIAKEGSAVDVAAAMQQVLDDGGGTLRIETGDDAWVVLRPGDIARVAVNGFSEEVDR